MLVLSSSWTGRRDHALFALAARTALRVSELIGLRCAEVHFGVGAHISCLGKGRKQRITPITKGMVGVLRNWLAERAGQAAEPLFATHAASAANGLAHRARQNRTKSGRSDDLGLVLLTNFC